MMFVSALCLSRGDQAMLDATHAAWCHQTLDPRVVQHEFVVVVDEDSPVRVPGRRVNVPAGTHLGKRRNIGLQACTGNIVAVLDDDDEHERDRLAVQCAPLLEGYRSSFLRDVLLEGRGRQAIGRLLAGWPQTLVAERAALIAAGGWSETAHHDGDLELLMRLHAAGGAKRVEHDRVLYRYREHESNVTGKAHWDAIWKRSVPLEKAGLHV